MKKLAAALALALATSAAALDLYPAHEVGKLAWATVNPQAVLEGIVLAATTTTWSNANRTAILTSDSGTESAPTAATVGLALDDISGVSVILKTSSNATAGGTLQAYLFNPETATWARAADLDLTATATTNQTWPALWVPVSRGRLYYNPSGIGSVQTTIYLVGQVRQ